MLSEQWAICVVGALLGIIIYEIRQLRQELKEHVPHTMCKVMMSDHDDRIERLEEKYEKINETQIITLNNKGDKE